MKVRELLKHIRPNLLTVLYFEHGEPIEGVCGDIYEGEYSELEINDWAVYEDYLAIYF